jgi:hypothetical protein
MSAFLSEITNNTVSGLVAAARESTRALLDGVREKIAEGVLQTTASNAGGVGTQWLKSLFGRSEWTLPCIGVRVVI